VRNFNVLYSCTSCACFCFGDNEPCGVSPGYNYRGEILADPALRKIDSMASGDKNRAEGLSFPGKDRQPQIKWLPETGRQAQIEWLMETDRHTVID